MVSLFARVNGSHPALFGGEQIYGINQVEQLLSAAVWPAGTQAPRHKPERSRIKKELARGSCSGISTLPSDLVEKTLHLCTRFSF